jgi:thiol-disulfide isomerase/thioredoxin
MSSSWITVVVVLVAALGVAVVAGRLLTRREGTVEATTDGPSVDADELGLSRSGPTILHFGAVWCGPCGALRRIVDQVCTELPAVAHVEIDLDANPEAARRLSVLSLPTTFIFDAEGRQQYRAAGVPTAADLRSALQPLLA